MEINTMARVMELQSQIRQKEKQTTGIYGSFFDSVVQAASVTQTEESAPAQAISLEEMLKARHPGLVYHVFDASTPYWRTREDYPFNLLYQKNINTEALENWKPSGPNPDQISPNVQRNLAAIPPGGKAVIIHPKVQERMEQDPEYANLIYQRIESWWAFDIARNEAILPGSTAGMSQAIAIGEDGNIANVQASSGPSMTRSKREEEEGPDFWELRKNRHDWYMKLWIEEQLQRRLTASAQLTATDHASFPSAKAQLIDMLNNDQLKSILGDTIAGTSVDEVFEHTRKDAFGTAYLL